MSFGLKCVKYVPWPRKLEYFVSRSVDQMVLYSFQITEWFFPPFKSFITTHICYVLRKTKLVLADWVPRYSSIILVLSLSALIFGCFGNWMYSELLNNYLHSVKVFSLQQKICQKCNSVNLERARGVSIPSNWLKFFN